MSVPFDAPPARQVLSPSQLNRLVRDLLGDALPMVWIEGELSNLARPASGHLYFTLKDAQAQVRCAMFRQRAQALRFRPADGEKVLLRARVGLYEARGEYQLVVESMEPAGVGALQREFEALKARLEAEGLFDPARKRQLPTFPQRIAVVTSPTGAAIRDVLSVIRRRWPLVQVDVLPVPVQGREAPPAITAMLRKASRAAGHDVLVLTRGGGSLEDLWAFNDEAVARAIHASSIPVVSAIGHEIDFTIADFVADLRAPTPSAAAELVVPDIQAVRETFAQRARRLATLEQRRLQALMQGLDHLQARLRAQRPQARLGRNRDRLAHLEHRLLNAWRNGRQGRDGELERLRARLEARHPQRRLPLLRQRLATQNQRLRLAIQHLLKDRGETLAQAMRTLAAVSPLATLERGYAILLNADGHVLRSAHAAPSGTPLRARLADGELALRVE